jgi:hypothetical protein
LRGGGFSTRIGAASRQDQCGNENEEGHASHERMI